eukprot:scaffold24680_cov113-Cylindrotheca_fusiformis.AAC.7
MTEIAIDQALSFLFKGRRISASYANNISPETASLALESEVFRTWRDRCEKSYGDKELDLHSVEIQSVDLFGPRVGFVKIKAESSLVQKGVHSEKRIPGICFLRGGAVTILVALICEQGGSKQVYTVLVDQPRVPIGAASCLELPAGMIDDINDGVGGTAARELEEECGIKLRPSDMVDLTELAFQDAMNDGLLPCSGVAPSPGGCDEYLNYMYVEQKITNEELEKMKGRMAGLRDDGEYITLRIVPMKDVWKISGDNKAMWYANVNPNQFDTC